MSDSIVNLVRKDLTVDHLFLGLVIATGLLVYLPGLGDFPLRRWDEALYANSARHMVQNGYWMIPHTQASYGVADFSLTPRIHKPPLMYWLQAVAMLMFGINEFAVRFPSALAAIATACIAYMIGLDVYDRWTGSASALVLLMLPPVYLGSHAGRTGESDMLLVLFGSLFVWWTWCARENETLLVPAAIAAGLAVLTKGFAAGIFVIILAPVIVGYWPKYLNWRGVRAAGLTVLIVMPWFAYLWFRFGDYFLDQFVYRTVIRRVAREKSTISSVAPMFEFMNFPYFKSLEWYFSSPPVRELFLLLLLAGSGMVIYSTVKKGWRENQHPLFLLWWLWIVPVAFAILGGDHQWYLLPMVVPGAILIGRVVARIVQETSQYTDQQFGYTMIDFRTYLSLGLISVVILAALYPPLGVGLADAEQKKLGATLNNEAPPGATIYIQANDDRNVINGERLQVFSFYAQRPLTRTDIGEINNNSNIRYALVESDSLSQIDHNYEVLLNTTESGVTAIEIKGRDA